MRTRELLKLKVGDLVSVTGTMSGVVFAGEKGVVIDCYGDARDDRQRTIKFDTWRAGWSYKEQRQNSCWSFDVGSVRHFNITVLPEVKPEPAPVAPKKRPHGKQEYKGNGKHEWEVVTLHTQRLRVPGGWLYATLNGLSIGHTTFVPVPSAVGYAV